MEKLSHVHIKPLKVTGTFKRREKHFYCLFHSHPGLKRFPFIYFFSFLFLFCGSKIFFYLIQPVKYYCEFFHCSSLSSLFPGVDCYLSGYKLKFVPSLLTCGKGNYSILKQFSCTWISTEFLSSHLAVAVQYSATRHVHASSLCSLKKELAQYCATLQYTFNYFWVITGLSVAPLNSNQPPSLQASLSRHKSAKTRNKGLRICIQFQQLSKALIGQRGHTRVPISFWHTPFEFVSIFRTVAVLILLLVFRLLEQILYFL